MAGKKQRNIFRWRRQLLNLTQMQLGRLADVDQSDISRLERRRYSEVSLETARRVAAFLGLNPSWIFPDEKPAKTGKKTAEK